MSATVPRFLAVLTKMGSDVLVHSESGATPCPCRTPEGFRDLEWHAANPLAPMCNENGILSVKTEFYVKAAVQPVSAMRGRLAPERLESLFLGEVQTDDHLGIFPITWGGNSPNFHDWGTSGDDFIIYDGRRYVVVASDKMPDVDGDPNHHWELGLRLVGDRT
jgi:hypothetical protein